MVLGLFGMSYAISNSLNLILSTIVTNFNFKFELNSCFIFPPLFCDIMFQQSHVYKFSISLVIQVYKLDFLLNERLKKDQRT